MGRTTPALSALALLVLAGCGEDEAPAPSPGAATPEPVTPVESGEVAEAIPAAPPGDKDDELAADASGPFQIGPSGDLRGMAMRYRHLWRDGNGDGVWLAPLGDGEYALMAPEGTPAERARQIAAAVELEATAKDASREEGLEPSVIRTTVPLNVRTGPDGGEDLVRTMPEGTVAVVVHGEIEGERSEAGGRGHWSWTMASWNDTGWSASRYHEPHDGCLPIPARLLDDVPAGRVADLRRDVTYTAVHLRIDGRPAEGWMLLARDPEQVKSHVAIVRDRGRCNVQEVQQYSVDGIVEDAFVVPTQRAGGESLVVTVSHPEVERDPEGNETYHVHLLDRSEPVWDRTLPTGPNASRMLRWSAERAETEGASGVAGYWPLAFIPADMQAGPGEYFAWTGSTLEHDDAALDAPEP